MGKSETHKNKKKRKGSKTRKWTPTSFWRNHQPWQDVGNGKLTRRRAWSQATGEEGSPPTHRQTRTRRLRGFRSTRTVNSKQSRSIRKNHVWLVFGTSSGNRTKVQDAIKEFAVCVCSNPAPQMNRENETGRRGRVLPLEKRREIVFLLFRQVPSFELLKCISLSVSLKVMHANRIFVYVSQTWRTCHVTCR